MKVNPFSVPPFFLLTSDTFPAFPSEVPLKALDLRHFLRISVGGAPRKPWTSDTFPAFLSEVPFESLGPPTLFRHFCRRYPSKVLDLRHFSGLSVGGGHKASRASPLGRARAACFECSALVPAEHGAVGRESLLLYWMEIWKQHWPWSANTPADHYFVLGRTIAGQNQGRRFKAFSANETQRVRTECFVRMLIFRQ